MEQRVLKMAVKKFRGFGSLREMLPRSIGVPMMQGSLKKHASPPPSAA